MNGYKYGAVSCTIEPMILTRPQELVTGPSVPSVTLRASAKAFMGDHSLVLFVRLPRSRLCRTPPVFDSSIISEIACDTVDGTVVVAAVADDPAVLEEMVLVLNIALVVLMSLRVGIKLLMMVFRVVGVVRSVVGIVVVGVGVVLVVVVQAVVEVLLGLVTARITFFAVVRTIRPIVSTRLGAAVDGRDMVPSMFRT